MIDMALVPELYGLWPQRRVYDCKEQPAWSEEEARAAVEEYFLETKSHAAAPAEELRVLLNEMTAEMRAQFTAFRDLRKAAEIAAAGNGDEAAAKLARADLKAATDAMALIVRTLEKIDQLQRQFARDRELADEQNEATVGLDDAKTRFLERIEQRAAERANELLAAWRATGPPVSCGAVSGEASVVVEAPFAGEATIAGEEREAEAARRTEPG